jgi:hypothetical protein
MSQLHNAINEYIRTLQTLAAQNSNYQDLLDTAEKKWGQESPEYMLLVSSPPQRWINEPGNPPTEAEKPEDEINVTVDWLPILQDLADNCPDDDGLLRKVKADYTETSYLYRLIKRWF